MKAEFVPIQNGVKRKDLEPFTVFFHGMGSNCKFMSLPSAYRYTSELLCVDLTAGDILDTDPDAICFPQGKFVFKV